MSATQIAPQELERLSSPQEVQSEDADVVAAFHTQVGEYLKSLEAIKAEDNELAAALAQVFGMAISELMSNVVLNLTTNRPEEIEFTLDRIQQMIKVLKVKGLYTMGTSLETLLTNATFLGRQHSETPSKPLQFGEVYDSKDAA